MTEGSAKPEVRHNVDGGRFELQLSGNTAVLEYTLRGDTITFTHTGVPGELEGRGIGGQLARAGLDYAREKSLKVVPACWFVAGFIKRNDEYKSLLA